MDDTIKKTVGGFKVQGDTIITGGQERVIGENTIWYLRDKFIRLGQSPQSGDPKSLLRIINLSIPISFNKRIFYDGDENGSPSISTIKSTKDIHKKSMMVLKKRLNDPICTIVKRSVDEYNLRAPLFWILSDIIKFLSVLNKKRKPGSGKIKISPSMVEIIERIWKNDKYFQYVINSDDAPDNMIDLITHLLSVIQQSKPPDGRWSVPYIQTIKYPCICSMNKGRIQQAIRDEKEKLASDTKSMGDVDCIRRTILSILTIEKILAGHVEDIEKYYIAVAKNMHNIYVSMVMFFRKI